MTIDTLASAGRAQRAFEHLNLLGIVHGNDALNHWVAISLADGACDQQLYPSKADAVRHQLHPAQCAYLFFTGMPTLKELRYYLDQNEELYDSGFELADPDSYPNPEFML
ncbi:hypothetical protein [Streptomyces sp. NPDC087787]|uniref:hypothetical protein n=1 Tax=Streptomyces sp. NPDC087787 TaxID=3365803 RepID=UPI00381BF77D